MTLRHIIFDLDGTLIDSAAHCAAIANEMLQLRGSTRRICRDETVPYMSYGGEHLVKSLLAADLGELEQDVGQFRALYAATPTPESCLFANVREGLGHLASSGYVIGVCSNKPQSLCEKIIDELGLSTFVASIVGSRTGVPPKPDPAMLLLNLAEMSGSATTALLVGDSEIDSALASATGVPFWQVTYGYAGANWKPVADATFDNFEAVVAAIPPLGKPSGEA